MNLLSSRGRVVAGFVGLTSFSVVSWAQSPAPAQAAIDGVIAAGAKVELIKDGFTGGEGPVATADGGLYFTDIRASRIYKLDRNGTIAVWRENTRGANGLFLTRDGRLVAAAGEAKQIVAIMPDGSVTPLVTEFDGKPLRGPNDLIVDRKGGIYFTDPAPRGASEPSLVLYRRPSGEVVLIDSQFIFPNGLSLSLDEKILYVLDINSEYVHAYDTQPDGSVKNKRPFAKLAGFTQPATGPARSGADGMAVDSKGRLYVTSDIGVQVISPRGQNLGTIQVPTKARNVAFGGPRRQTLYITAAAELYRVALMSEGPSGRAK
jgi:gluconolactonase